MKLTASVKKASSEAFFDPVAMLWVTDLTRNTTQRQCGWIK